MLCGPAGTTEWWRRMAPATACTASTSCEPRCHAVLPLPASPRLTVERPRCALAARHGAALVATAHAALTGPPPPLPCPAARSVPEAACCQPRDRRLRTWKGKAFSYDEDYIVEGLVSVWRVGAWGLGGPSPARVPTRAPGPAAAAGRRRGPPSRAAVAGRLPGCTAPHSGLPARAPCGSWRRRRARPVRSAGWSSGAG